MLAEVNHADLEVLWLILAFGAFGCAVAAGYLGRIPAAVVCAFVGVLILLFAL